MATQQQADATLAHHQDALFERIPNLTKLSVVKDAAGDWIIEACVIDMNIQRSFKGTDHDAETVPDSLEIPDTSGRLSAELLPVRIVRTGDISALAQPCVADV